jgi:hypothetical protein
MQGTRSTRLKVEQGVCHRATPQLVHLLDSFMLARLCGNIGFVEFEGEAIQVPALLAEHRSIPTPAYPDVST